jgi:hypothetical protein
VARRIATMDRAPIGRQEGTVGGGVGRSRGGGHRRGVRRDLGLAVAYDLDPVCPGDRSGLRPGGTVTNPGAGSPDASASHHHYDHDDDGPQPGGPRRMPRAPAPATSARTAAMAPGRARDVPATGDAAGPMDFAHGRDQRQGYVDLAVGQY